MALAKGSHHWILSSFIITIMFSILIIYNNGWISFIAFLCSIFFALVTIFFIVFFRDPHRKTGTEIVAAADGKIREISKTKNRETGNYIFISTFMRIHDVHVNRMPIDGKIREITHKAGSHIPAFKKESERNEQVKIEIETDIGLVKIVQIAGILARRIKPYIKKGDNVKKGDRIGIIRLGSRVDLYLPSNKIKEIRIKVGDKVMAGETTIAEIND